MQRGLFGGLVTLFMGRGSPLDTPHIVRACRQLFTELFRAEVKPEMHWLIVFTLPQLFTEALAIDRYYGDDEALLNCNRPQGVRIDVRPTWHHNGRELDLTLSGKYSVRNSGEALTILDVKYSDEGNYTCLFDQDVVVFADTLRVVSKPVFSSCNQTTCENQEFCTATHGIEVVLDLQITFINSASMTMGPSPHRIEVAQEVNRIQTSVLSCSDTDCVLPRMGYSWRGMPPNNLSLLIPSVNQNFSGMYTATATVRRPSSIVDLLLTKTFTISARNCPPSAPRNESVSVNGCVASYTCDNRDIRVTRQCLESNSWSGSNSVCDQMTSTSSSPIVTSRSFPAPQPTTATLNPVTTTFTTTTMQKASLIAISIAVPLAVVVLAVMLLIIIMVAVVLAWQRGHKQGSREVHAPSSQEIIHTQFSEQHRIVVSHNLHEVKEGWRASLNIEQQIELPIQTGVPNVEIAV